MFQIFIFCLFFTVDRIDQTCLFISRKFSILIWLKINFFCSGVIPHVFIIGVCGSYLWHDNLIFVIIHGQILYISHIFLLFLDCQRFYACGSIVLLCHIWIQIILVVFINFWINLVSCFWIWKIQFQLINFILNARWLFMIRNVNFEIKSRWCQTDLPYQRLHHLKSICFILFYLSFHFWTKIWNIIIKHEHLIYF